ncbi:hypothetical protein R1sor_004373 [Riccia sorocarpa]|uniref:Photolyase/cryptochrome alpha/beta domain-containing protein n=1 Tax=Riccia sorocarpa TaxID=122646 RepID=A0ABD3HGR4_9MARC
MAGVGNVGTRSIIWFRKGLRLHDNPALHKACQDASHVFPVFVLDPFFLAPDPTAPTPGSSTVGVNRIHFLLESLRDLNANLESRGTKLLLVQGNPVEVLPELLEKWSINRLCFEFDTEPYAQVRDKLIMEFCEHRGIEVHTPVSHTIFDPREIIAKNGGKPPLTYQAFCRKLGKPPKPLADVFEIPALPLDLRDVNVVPLPSLEELGYVNLKEEFSPFRGGETEGLKRLEECLADKKWVSEFEKPKGDPTAFLKPATTCLSPYFKFGCVSVRLFYFRLLAVYAEVKKHSKPPVSLEGQILWREFFYTAGYGTPNFDRMVGNPICRQIPWKDDENLLSCWRDGRTGYPWIDAAMIQLRKWGWLHHLARHAVACFLTRGDLFVYWEKGRDVFDRLLVDADWALNNGNWLWLSASAFFAQYHRIYSPATFAKKYDPDGKYIKHFIPALKDMPKAYIYEPWTAPLSVQKKANCIIGIDYPKPVVDHAIANKICRDRMGAAFALNKQAAPGQPTQEQVDNLNNRLNENLDVEADQQDARAGTDSGEEKSTPSPKPKVKRQRKLPFQKTG